jgi:hypothetical protein
VLFFLKKRVCISRRSARVFSLCEREHDTRDKTHTPPYKTPYENGACAHSHRVVTWVCIYVVK